MSKNQLRFVCLGSILLVLSACGGGGGDTPPPPTNPTSVGSWDSMKWDQANWQ